MICIVLEVPSWSLFGLFVSQTPFVPPKRAYLFVHYPVSTIVLLFPVSNRVCLLLFLGSPNQPTSPHQRSFLRHAKWIGNLCSWFDLKGRVFREWCGGLLWNNFYIFKFPTLCCRFFRMPSTNSFPCCPPPPLHYTGPLPRVVPVLRLHAMRCFCVFAVGSFAEMPLSSAKPPILTVPLVFACFFRPYLTVPKSHTNTKLGLPAFVYSHGESVRGR